MRRGLVEKRTAQANRLRGLLGEYGIVIGKGLAQLRKRLPEILEDAENDFERLGAALFADLHGRILALDQQVAAYGARLKALNEVNEVCRKIGRAPGVGPIMATAMAASLGDGQAFETGRQVSAWLGLVPGQESQARRHLSAHPAHPWARAVVRADAEKHEAQSRWINELVKRRNANIAAVAVANKNARVIWALLRRGENYRAPVSANA